jgi:hypothetical protein
MLALRKVAIHGAQHRVEHLPKLRGQVSCAAIHAPRIILTATHTVKRALLHTLSSMIKLHKLITPILDTRLLCVCLCEALVLVYEEIVLTEELGIFRVDNVVDDLTECFLLGRHCVSHFIRRVASNPLQGI